MSQPILLPNWKIVICVVAVATTVQLSAAEEDANSEPTNGLATINVPIGNRAESLFEPLHCARRLAESGAGYEAARVIAAIAANAQETAPGREANEWLKDWELTIEEIRTGQPHEINAKIAKRFHNNSQARQVELSHIHLRNLVDLELFDDAAEYLVSRLLPENKREVTERLGDILREFRIPSELLSNKTGEKSKELALAFAKSFHRRKLHFEAASLWSLDHEAAEIAERLWYEIAPDADPDRYRDEEDEPFRRWVEGDFGREHDESEAEAEERYEEEPLDEITSVAVQRALKLAKKHPNASRVLAKLVVEANPDSIAAATAQTLLAQIGAIPPLVSLAPVEPKERIPRMSANSSDTDVFDDVRVRDYRITLTDEAVEQLHRDPKRYVHATFHEGDDVYKNVGLRIKGGWGSFRMIDGRSKAAFTIKFNQFEKEQRFHGLRRIILNNGAQDASYLHEYVGYSLFRDAGVPAPRINFANVKVNDDSYGFYIQVEAVTKDFLQRWFDETKGNLYEGPGDVIHWEEIDLDTNQDKEDRSDLRALAEAIENADDVDPWSSLGGLINIDQFTRFFAMEQLLNHWDGYTQINNYRIYSDPQSKSFHFIPHGCDQLFEEPGGSVFEHDQGGILGRAMLQTDSGQALFRQTMTTLLARWDEAKLRGRIAEAYSVIRPHVATNRGKSEHDVEEFEHMVGRLLEFVAIRRSVVASELKRSASKPSWREHPDEHRVPSFWHRQD